MVSHLVVDLVLISQVCKVTNEQFCKLYIYIYISIEEKKEEVPKPAGGFSFGGGFGANKPGM